MALLDGLLGGLQGGAQGQGGTPSLNPEMLAQLAPLFGAYMQQQQQDPFSGPMPGEALLGASPGGSPQQGGQPPMQEGGPPQQGFQGGMQEFANTGLPTIPENMGGFGYGNTAPQEMGGGQGGLRSKLINEILGSQMQGLQGFGDGFSG